jgi:hypothetical protein
MYQWYDCSTNLPISGETNQSFTATSNGIYQVEVTLNGCTDVSVCEAIASVGLKEINLNSIKVYPNPTKNSINIQSETTVQEFSIIDINGRVVHDEIVNAKLVLDVDVSGIDSGVYFIKIVDINGNFSVSKFLKK